MPRKARELSPLEVRRLTKPGRWSVGGVDGLALQVTGTAARSWVLRLTVAGKKREMGLGSFPSVSLADAREKARAYRNQVDVGDDPIARRQAAVSAAAAERSRQQTFAKTAEAYIEQHEKSWKNAKHAAQWTATLQTYANPVLGSLLVRDITAALVDLPSPVTCSTASMRSIIGRDAAAFRVPTACGLGVMGALLSTTLDQEKVTPFWLSSRDGKSPKIVAAGIC